MLHSRSNRWIVWISSGAVVASALSNALVGQVPAPRAASVCDVGDIDGDGIADILVAHRSAGTHEQAWVLSGKDGSCLRTLAAPRAGMDLGLALAAASDVDLDGTPDVALTASEGKLESALLYSGKSGALLRETRGIQPPTSYRLALAAGGDWNADGVPDLAYLAPGAGANVLSGKDGATLASLPINAAGVGKPTACNEWQSARASIAFTGTGAAQDREALVIGVDGKLLVWSAADPSARKWLHNKGLVVGAYDKRTDVPIDTESDIQLGSCTAALGDVDGDRVPDVISSLIESDYAVISGATGKVLSALSYEGYQSSGEGSSVDAAGDFDGDGRTEVLVCANEQEENGFGPRYFERGSAWVHDAAPTPGTRPHTHFEINCPDFDHPEGAPSAYGIDGCGPGDLDRDGGADLVLALHPVQGSWARSLGHEGKELFVDLQGKSADQAFPELVRAYSGKDSKRVLWEMKLDALPKSAPR
jgi:hypothetical protein